jgi:trk system potassium uptake protein TrkH
LGIPLVGEGVAMALCVVPALLFGDGTALWVALAAAITIVTGVLLLLLPSKESDGIDKRKSYFTVTLMWVVLALFGTLPFLFTRSVGSFTDAFFESLSGMSSTGATIFPDVGSLPASLLLWRSMTQWLGGFGIIMLVLAVVPSLGMNKYSLYTAEVSSADNTGKTTTSMRAMVRQTLSIYCILTALFIVLLLLSGMTLWEAVNLTFTNISTGGFSIYSDSIASFTPQQQYILAASMFMGGINFALLYNFFTFKWSKINRKLDQFGFYFVMVVLSTTFVVLALHFNGGAEWSSALRDGIVQTVSVVTTTGSVVADTNLWWTPIVYLFLVLSLCGGMAGSTTGGVKVMRVLILFRNVRNTLRNRLHPHSYNPVRLNGKPVPEEIVTNVMVIFMVYAVTVLLGVLLLMLCGVGATESLGAAFGCITSYGPGLGTCGGFGSYAGFPLAAKWICSAMMLLGRLECLTVLIIFLPGFWKNR